MVTAVALSTRSSSIRSLLAPSVAVVVERASVEFAGKRLQDHTPSDDWVGRDHRDRRTALDRRRAVRAAAPGPETGGRAWPAQPRLAASADKILATPLDDPAAMPETAGQVTDVVECIPMSQARSPAAVPKCGMKLLASLAPTVTAYACPMHPEVVSDQPVIWPL